jgi:hypothetical protein
MSKWNPIVAVRGAVGALRDCCGAWCPNVGSRSSCRIGKGISPEMYPSRRWQAWPHPVATLLARFGPLQRAKNSPACWQEPEFVSV